MYRIYLFMKNIEYLETVINTIIIKFSQVKMKFNLVISTNVTNSSGKINGTKTQEMPKNPN